MSGVRVPHRPTSFIRNRFAVFRTDAADMQRFIKKYIRRSKAWRHKVFKKTERLIRRLRKRDFSDERIADYFLHQNLSQNEKKFCPLFADGHKCHILSSDRLNCLGCYCPYFSADVTENEGVFECGHCEVNSPAAQRVTPVKHPNLRILDCSMCVIPHQHSRVMKILDRDFPRTNG